MLGVDPVHGDATVLVVDLEAPTTPGDYQLIVCLVQEGFIYVDRHRPIPAPVAQVTVT